MSRSYQCSLSKYTAGVACNEIRAAVFADSMGGGTRGRGTDQLIIFQGVRDTRDPLFYFIFLLFRHRVGPHQFENLQSA